MKKRFFGMILVMLLAVSGTAWGAEDDGTFTRGDFAAMLVDAAQLTGEEGDQSPASLLVEKGIIQGYPGGDLGLEKEISRLEAVSFVGRTLGLKDDISPPEQGNAPLDATHWGYNLYSWLNYHGLITGEPGDILNAEEGAAFLNKVFTSQPEALQIVEKTQEAVQAKNQTLSMVLEGTMKMTPRLGVAGAEEIPLGDSKMRIEQEMVLPDQIHQKITMTMVLPGSGEETMTMETYMAGGEMYQQLPDEESGTMKWYRYPKELMPDLKEIMEMAEKQGNAIPSELEEYLHYNLLGTTQVGGEDVHRIAFYGRIDDLSKFLNAAMGQFGDNADLQQAMSQSIEIIDSITYWGIEHIGVADYLPRNAELNIIMTYSDEFMGEPMPISALEMMMNFEEYRYGDDLVIQVPQEALDAPMLELPDINQPMIQ
ncbi:DUF6612 family protein [Dehalobacterium formicoaceticum]|uniref:DUF6612 family protein n=1 Tax=Dehalobacterium formicoaceticum TaxID=51515 RepID=UPI0031F64B58